MNVANDDHVRESNENYIERYGELTENIVRKNLSTVSYGEMPFTSLYTGTVIISSNKNYGLVAFTFYTMLCRDMGHT